MAITKLRCQAWVIRPSCSLTVTFNHGDLVLTPDMEFYETRTQPFVASVQLTPSLEVVFSTLPSATADLNVYLIGTARKEKLFSAQKELAALRHVKSMTSQDLHDVINPFSQYYTTNLPSTGRALVDYMPMRIAISLVCFSMTISVASFTISATIFRRQWQRFFKHPQRFFRGTHGRFLNLVLNLEDDGSEQATAFLYVTNAEFAALRELT